MDLFLRQDFSFFTGLTEDEPDGGEKKKSRFHFYMRFRSIISPGDSTGEKSIETESWVDDGRIVSEAKRIGFGASEFRFRILPSAVFLFLSLFTAESAFLFRDSREPFSSTKTY